MWTDLEVDLMSMQIFASSRMVDVDFTFRPLSDVEGFAKSF